MKKLEKKRPNNAVYPQVPKYEFKKGNVFHFFHYLLLLQFFIIDARIILLDFLGPKEDNPTW